ncbi:hypothetical protein J6X15_01900 [Candidatus Saccharibacteria bacterium]|nr:hypothetical protein [Candidatus Saccharibacteria bacterium]
MVFRKIGKKIYNLVTTAIDRAKFAVSSIWMLLKRPKYLASFLVSLFVFLYILSFFKDGSGNWLLLCSNLSFGAKLEVLGRVCVKILDNFTDLYGILIILMSILQALTIMLLIFTWRNREKDHAIDGASTGGIGAIFGFIALGCPTCGISILAPLLTAVAGTGAMAAAEGISKALIVLAFILLIYTVIKLGYVSFVTMSAKKYKEKKHAKSR